MGEDNVCIEPVAVSLRVNQNVWIENIEIN